MRLDRVRHKLAVNCVVVSEEVEYFLETNISCRTMWNKLPCPRSELELLFTLCGGQCFRWKKTGDREWTGVFANRVWKLSQNDENILYKVTTTSKTEGTGRSIDAVSENKTVSDTERRMKTKIAKGKMQKKFMQGAVVTDQIINESGNKETENDCVSVEYELLKKYFRLDVPLQENYVQWSEKDPHFKEVAGKFSGVRILAQDPVENIFSFICSSNNNIARISSMVEKLCLLYGQKIAEVDGKVYYDFPPIAALIEPSVEKELRDAGFGYRAKFIHQSASKIMQMGGISWLQNLQSMSYKEAKLELMKLPGIGAKVADCVCLMSLGHLEAIPIDTHIYQVAVQRYLPHLKCHKTVTDKIYNEIGDHFRSLFGSLAGWAHTILFCADLKMFQDTAAKHKMDVQDRKSKTKRKKI